MIPNFDHFPLRGRKIGISISQSTHEVPLGEDPKTFINKLTFQTCSRYLYLGAYIVTGHQWQPDGITQHLVKRATQFRYSFADSNKPRILNSMAWPNLPPAVDSDGHRREDLDGVEISQILPPGIPVENLDPASELGKFARTRALTALRRKLAAQSDLRICLGGALVKPHRRLPGILEEAIFTWQEGKPLYLAGAHGGITRLMCEAILHRRLSSEATAAFYSPADTVSLYEEFSRGYPVPKDECPSTPGGAVDCLEYLRSIPVPELASRAHLCEDEYLAMMDTPDINRALDLCSTGIMRSVIPPYEEAGRS